MLGVDPATREQIPGLELFTDAVTLSAPVIECKVKPSMPIGTSAQDAFGGSPVFEDRGLRRRAICAIGRQDAPPEGLTPLDPRIRVLGASSDHLVLDVDDLPHAAGHRRRDRVPAGLLGGAGAVHVGVRAKEYVGGE